ncbi:unnamed protein product [Prorocentrum cordatum]|uniref:VTT domain-containing protein n=1 Tax=Prorocentrum cordatum TaxID=2364126 RepID=A0ABN9UI30_9DINO|nr:unnamed protein product [Polarella glacialis]
MELVKAAPPSVLVPLHAASIVVALPGHLAFELGEGYLFGFSKGFALAMTGKSIGSLAAFTIGRSCLGPLNLRDRMHQQLESWPSARRIAKRVESNGGLTVFLIRIAPVPCVVKNYAVAVLTDVSYPVYFAGTLAGLLPTTAAHVAAGALTPSMADLASGHGIATRAVALASTVVGLGMISVVASLCLREDVADEDGEACEEEPGTVKVKAAD